MNLEEEFCNELRKLNLMNVYSLTEAVRKKLIFKSQKDWDKFTELAIQYIEKAENKFDKEFLVRLIGDKYCTKAIDYLIELFKKTEDDSLRWVIGNSLSLIKIPSEKISSISELIINKKYGRGRQMLLDIYARNKKYADFDAIYRVLDDPDVSLHAISALGQLGKDQNDIEKIKPLLKHENKYIRKRAEKAIGYITKRMAKIKNK